MESPLIKVAYGSIPKDGGTFTFYRNHRAEFLALGVDVRCVTVGAQQARLWTEEFADDGCVRLDERSYDIKHQAQQFVAWCEQEAIDIVIGVNSIPMLAAIEHLPESVRIVSRCANAFPEGYRVTVAGRERLGRIVALTPRLRDDLIRDYEVAPELISLIPNGVALERFPERDFSCDPDGGVDQERPIQLGFLGRLEHNQKGVLHLPKILEWLDRMGVDYRLSIAGTGKHEADLRQSLQSQLTAGKVEFCGKMIPEQVPEFLRQTEVFLFTSHFEGCPNALLEALAAGCVPVSWIVEGITDFLLEEGQTGFLVPLEDHRMFAERIRMLAENRSMTATISRSARKAACERFSTKACAKAYTGIFQDLMAASPVPWTPRPWKEFRVEPGIGGKSHWIPSRIKDWLKSLVGITR